MPETPDFEKIAERIVAPQYVAFVVEELTAAWNARGAADIAKIESELSTMMGATASGPFAKNLDQALRTLDR